MAGTCKDCKHFTKPPQSPADTGLCTRYPPLPMLLVVQTGKVAGSPMGQTIQAFAPPVNEKAWCGEYAPGKQQASLVTN